METRRFMDERDLSNDPAHDRYESLIASLPASFQFKRNEPLRYHTTLRVGGPADLFYHARSIDELAQVAMAAHKLNVPTFILGWGSNVLASDKGVRALVILNDCRRIEVGVTTYAECGISFQETFLRTAQASLSGLEFAVGIPGTLGGALVSNAGAYRANICDLLLDIDLVSEGKRMLVTPDWMQFSYRDSRLRRPNPPPTVLLAVRLKLQPGDKHAIFAKARDIQRQRTEKQPPEASAGSFFKNVYDRALAESLPDLPRSMKEAGVVPAGYLNMACGLKGLRVGGAAISTKHANFLVNKSGATATDLRCLASLVKRKVFERFSVHLEEEVLYIGDWDGWEADCEK